MENSKLKAERISLVVATIGLIIMTFDQLGARSNGEELSAGLRSADFIAEIVLIAAFATLVFRALNRPARVTPSRGTWMWGSVGVIGALACVTLLTLRLERSISQTPRHSRSALADAEFAPSPGPPERERQKMKGLGRTGWAAEVEVELLREGESREEALSQRQNEVKTPIVINLDAEGNASMFGQSFAPDRLREWLADAVATFGALDPVILCPIPATPLPALDRTTATVLGAGMTRIHVLADSQLERAHSVRLHGTSVRITSNVELPNPAPD